MSPTWPRFLSARIAGALLVASLMPMPLTACASSLARVDVYDRTNDQALVTYRRRGHDYVVGQPGDEYAIRIRNCSGSRVLAVVSVDGVNVITGETAAPDQSGYVIEPYGYVNIEGWRKDLKGTAAFYFSDPGDAYATRTGRPDDLGVIGVAVFRERERQVLRLGGELYRSAPSGSRQESAADAQAKGTAAESNAAAAPALGTGHGRREWSPAREVEFERASARPDQRLVIRYDRHENLVAMGVLPREELPWREPNPFPGARGFVPDP
jgi:hypothetical protein